MRTLITLVALLGLSLLGMAASTPPTVACTTPVLIREDTALLPVAEFADWLGGTAILSEDNTTCSVSIPEGTYPHAGVAWRLPTNVATLRADQTAVEVNGTACELMSGPARLIDGAMYVPMRDFLALLDGGEQTSFWVEWKPKTFRAEVWLMGVDEERIASAVRIWSMPARVLRVAYTKATIVTSRGTIEVELYPKDAPATVANFAGLARRGFYNGLTFHRVETSPTFQIIQGGCPKGDGTGGSDQTIKLETSPKLTHVEGAIAMARTHDPNSASSQFYICNCAIHTLDGQYAVFGKVVKGLDVSKRIQVGDRIVKVTVE